ncbi:MAG: hypothetical protein WBA57_22040 [Elainellaceae cyanobacterium]
MSTSIVLVEPYLAQAQPAEPSAGFRSEYLWMAASGILLVTLIVLSVMADRKMKKLKKEKRFEEFKNRELQKKLKLSLQTITKMERNPDLIHSREFNLDYLRMRMEEEQFHFAIVNQIKMRVKEKVSLALRSSQSNQGVVGLASTGRKIDQVFDVQYDLSERVGGKRGVLFRIQIRLMKLPTQPTSVTIQQIVQCLEAYMSPKTDHDTWQPTVQGRIASIDWDQKAKPTPMLVLEQSNEGVNVTFRTNRMVRS